MKPQIFLACLSILCLGIGAANAQTPALPTGSANLPSIDRLYARESDNSLLAYATPAGYQDLHDLVKHLDGDLDAIQTEVSYVQITSVSLQSLELASQDPSQLLAAFQNQRFTITDHVRLTTREDTVIETKLRASSPSASWLPLALVPREQDNGEVTVELLQPITPSTIFKSGETLLIQLPEQTDGFTRLLFLAPKIVASRLVSHR